MAKMLTYQELEQWREEVLRPARENTEGFREIKAGDCMVRYEIAQIPTGWAGRWEYRAPEEGSSRPWFRAETREKVLEGILREIKHRFTGSGNPEKQELFSKVSDAGLFGFIEPEVKT